MLLAIAAVTALGVIGAAGPGAASATVLCKVKEESCPRESAYPVPSKIEASLIEKTELEFKDSKTTKCAASVVTGETTSEEEESGEAPLVGKIASFSFGSSCTGCKHVEALNLPYKTSLVPAATEGNGVLTVESSGKGKPSFKFSECTLGATCTFGATQIEYQVKGGEPAAVEAEKATLSYESGSGAAACGETATMQDRRNLILPWGVIVTRSTVLCEEKIFPCAPVNKIYKKNALLKASLEAGVKAKWETNAVEPTTIECTVSSMTGESTRKVGVPGKLTPSFAGCNNNCEAEVRNPPYNIHLSTYLFAPLGDGVLEIEGFSVKLRCKNGSNEIIWECQYGQNLGQVTEEIIVKGGNPAKFEISRLVNRQAGTVAACGTAVKLTGKYFFEEPKPMFLI